MNHDWTTVAVVIFGYAVGTFYQLHYIDAKVEGLKLYIDARLKAIDARLDKIEARLDKIEARMEDRLVRP
jgi:hypothetical protein